ELYWRTADGTNVQLTAGNSLNASLLAGFTGDYGSGAEEASYSSSAGRYDFLRAANHRAFLDCADIRLFEGASGVANAVRLQSPAGLVAGYDWIFPSDLPTAGQTRVLLMDSAGQVRHDVGGTIASLVCSGNLTTEALTVEGDPGVFNAGIVCAVDQNVEVKIGRASCRERVWDT